MQMQPAQWYTCESGRPVVIHLHQLIPTTTTTLALRMTPTTKIRASGLSELLATDFLSTGQVAEWSKAPDSRNCGICTSQDV